MTGIEVHQLLRAGHVALSVNQVDLTVAEAEKHVRASRCCRNDPALTLAIARRRRVIRDSVTIELDARSSSVDSDPQRLVWRPRDRSGTERQRNGGARSVVDPAAKDAGGTAHQDSRLGGSVAQVGDVVVATQHPPLLGHDQFGDRRVVRAEEREGS